MPKKVLPPGYEKIAVFGPYSSVMQVGNHYHFAGVVPDLSDEGGALHPASNDVVDQYRQVMTNANNALAAVGLTMADVIRIRVFFRGAMSRTPEFNTFYAEALSGLAPVRTMIGAFDLPFGVQVEIEMDAAKQTEE